MTPACGCSRVPGCVRVIKRRRFVPAAASWSAEQVITGANETLLLRCCAGRQGRCDAHIHGADQPGALPHLLLHADAEGGHPRAPAGAVRADAALGQPPEEHRPRAGRRQHAAARAGARSPRPRWQEAGKGYESLDCTCTCNKSTHVTRARQRLAAKVGECSLIEVLTANFVVGPVTSCLQQLHMSWSLWDVSAASVHCFICKLHSL